MYNIKCYCNKMSYDKMNIMKSWMYRKCIKCKSNFVVYEDGIMIMDYNNIPKLYMVRQLKTLSKYNSFTKDKVINDMNYEDTYQSLNKFISVLPKSMVIEIEIDNDIDIEIEI